MRQNPIDVLLYRLKDNENPNAADTLIGMYRTDMRHNTAKIAINVAVREQIKTGVGAWRRLVTDYEDQDPTSKNRVIRRLPIHEAALHVIWDSNARACYYHQRHDPGRAGKPLQMKTALTPQSMPCGAFSYLENQPCQTPHLTFLWLCRPNCLR